MYAVYTKGQVYTQGSDTESMARYVNLGPDSSPDDVIVDVSIADQYILCVTDDGRVYSWGKNTGSTIQVSNGGIH